MAGYDARGSAAGEVVLTGQADDRFGGDANQDGKLTRQEFLAGQPNPEEAPKRFPRFDTNHDGELSREEFIGGGR